MKNTSKTTADRRSFLKLAGASVVGGGAAMAATTGAQATEAAKPTGNGDYRASEHVKKYYDLAREY